MEPVMMPHPLFQAKLWVIAVNGGVEGFYAHGYPLGRLNPWPQAQFYQTKAAAVRQMNKLKAEKRFEDKAISLMPVSVSVMEET
jgi:hypothetical protein